MANSKSNLNLLPEKRINLTIQAIQTSQILNIKTATQLYNIPYTTLHHRLKGRITRHNVQINNRKLIITEEKALLQYVKSLDNNGFSPTLLFVQKMAN
jgi:hypothetical protein